MEGLMTMDVLRCDGRTSESVRRQGSAHGHLLPAAALLFWGLNCFVGATWRYVLAARDPTAAPFFIRTWEPWLPFIPSKRWQRINQIVPFDAVYKLILPLIFNTIMFPMHSLLCPDGVRIGHIVGQRIVQWAHATLILSFVPVGLVELAQWMRVRFPAHTPIAVGVMSHISVSVVFLFHAKHELLDEVSHTLVGKSFVVAALADIIVLFKPNSIMALCGFVYFHCVGAVWLGATGILIFGDTTFWNQTFDGHTDVTPAIFCPITFGYVMLSVAALMLLLYTLLDMAAAVSLGQRPLGEGMSYACEGAAAAGREVDEREALLVTAGAGVYGEAVDGVGRISGGGGSAEGRECHLVRFR